MTVPVRRTSAKPPAYTPSVHRAAMRHLRRCDPVLSDLMARHGPHDFTVASGGTHFDALARSIVSQQLSVKAAATIHSRFRVLYDAAGGEPGAVARIPEARLREAGLSRQKIAYIRDLARRVSSGDLDLARVDEISDADLIERLTAVKGVGTWTAQMFLMFRLGRCDVLPTLDLGIQKAIQRAYRLRKLPTVRQMEKLGRGWAPYRTIACWYLWRSLDQPAVVKSSKARRQDNPAPSTRTKARGRAAR